MNSKTICSRIWKQILITIAVIIFARVVTGVSGIDFIKYAAVIGLCGLVGFYIDTLKRENKKLKKELQELE